MDSHKHLQMQNSVALGAIMGKLNIPLPAPEIPTPPIMPIMPVTKTKGEIEARKTVQGQDTHMERLIKTAK